jgi:hypothetical protein
MFTKVFFSRINNGSKIIKLVPVIIINLFALNKKVQKNREKIKRRRENKK